MKPLLKWCFAKCDCERGRQSWGIFTLDCYHALTCPRFQHTYEKEAATLFGIKVCRRCGARPAGEEE